MASECKRKRWNREDAIQVLEKWKASGMSLAAFARHESIGYPKLMWWKSTLDQPSESLFVPVTIQGRRDLSQPTSLCIVSVRLQDGTRISVRGRDAADLCSAMIDALRKSGGV